MKNLKYAIIGTGALGGYYGGRLANAGKEVHFLVNSDYEHIKNHGLKVDSVNGDFHLKSPHIYNDVNDMPKCDVVLVCLKTNNNHFLKELLPPILHDNTIVVLIQNGLNVEKQLLNQVPDINIAGGLAYICSTKIAPGHIKHIEYGMVSFGSFNLNDDSILENIANDFNEAGVKSTKVKNLQETRWRKLAWNIPFNGMAVVKNTTTDKLIDDPASRQEIKELMIEVIEASNACGFNIEIEYADKMLELTDKMAPYKTSMKVDFENNRPMEIGEMYDNPINEAKNYDYEMKKVQELAQKLRLLKNK